VKPETGDPAIVTPALHDFAAGSWFVFGDTMSPMPNIRFLLDRLEDPFELFPMQSVTASLADFAGRQEEDRFQRGSPWGVSSKYYTVEDEHDIEAVERLIGSTFVLGQAAITQAVSIVRSIHERTDKPARIPFAKDKIMDTAAPMHSETHMSKIAIINAVANCFKHRYEWWDDWSGPPASMQTIDIVTRLALSPKNYHNMEHALWQLGMLPDRMSALADIVLQWREQLAASMRVELEKQGS
jgi:hypothetical protein